METEDKKLNSNSNLWKAIALIVIGVLIGIFFGMKVLSAIELNLDKNQSCTLFNYTGVQCDSFWCVSGLKGNWTNDSICLINVIIKETINNTNQSFVFNETFMENFILNITFKVINQSELINESTLIATKNSILDGEQNRTETTVISYLDEYGGNQVVQTQPVPGWARIVLVLGVCFTAVAIFWIKSNKAKKDIEAEDFFRKPSEKDIYRPKEAYKSPEIKEKGKAQFERKFQQPIKKKDLADERLEDEETEEDSEGEILE
jgi:hypothetical protein